MPLLLSLPLIQGGLDLLPPLAETLVSGQSHAKYYLTKAISRLDKFHHAYHDAKIDKFPPNPLQNREINKLIHGICSN